MTITANDTSKTYGATGSYTASYSGFVAGDTSSVVSGLSFVSAGTTSTANVGSYAITAGSAVASNYTISYGANGTLSVTPASLTITGNDAVRLYNTTNPTFTASYVGPGGGRLDERGQRSYSWHRCGHKLADRILTRSPGGNPVASNYTVTYVAGTLSIVAGFITITANDATRLYGGTNPTFTASYSGDSSSITGLEFSTTATTGSGVGTYTITPYGAMSTDYSISYASGTLYVTPAPLVVTANNASRTTQQSDPAFTATFAGLVNGDLPSVVSGLNFMANDGANAPAGTYQIFVAGGYAQNYALTYQPGTLTVTAVQIQPQPLPQTNSYINSVLTSSFTTPLVTGFNVNLNSTGNSLQTLVNLLGNEGNTNFESGGSSSTECVKSPSGSDTESKKDCVSAVTIRGF